MSDIYRPLARVSALVVQDVAEETLIYDMAAHRAYCLNPMAASVWNLCDGTATVAEIAAAIDLGPRSEDAVWLAVDQFADLALLDRPPVRGIDKRARRQAIRALVVASLVTVPAISAIATPVNNKGVGSVCVCTSSSQCLATPGCGNSCGPLGICITTEPQITINS